MYPLFLLFLVNVESFKFNASGSRVISKTPFMKRKVEEIENNRNRLSDSPYRFKDGYRIVLPYQHSYRSHAKERWFNKPLYEVLISEFEALTEDYIKYACANKKIKVLSKDNVDLYSDDNDGGILKHELKSNEILYHDAIVHEQVALNQPIKILEETKDYLVVSKPTSIPVHHVGTYYYNSLVEIMKQEVLSSDIKLYPVNRIDKLVSGVVIFAKNPDTASELTGAIRNNLIKKVYIARVFGDARNFMEGEKEFFYLNNEKIVSSKGFMRVISRKYGKHEFTLDDKYKPTETRFRFIDYSKESNESLILCYPVTGRTHQISNTESANSPGESPSSGVWTPQLSRAHLKFIGHPISNDPYYNDGPLVDSERYFKGVPDVHWTVNEDGNWCLPEIDFVDDSNCCEHLKKIPFHVGLNRECKVNKRNPTGIYLHSFRYIWDTIFNITAGSPAWIDDFNVDPEHLKTLNLWT